MSIDCLRPLIKFWRIYRLGLKTKCFLASVDFSHQHRKYIHFFTINALLEYYFFNYKEIATFSEGKKKKSLTALLKTSIKRNNSLEPPVN